MDTIIEAIVQKPINTHLNTTIVIYISNIFYSNKYSTTICSYYEQNVDDLKVHSVLIVFLST